MKIKSLKIKNFRNITRADINFGDINVLTGRNSSGKSNFLLALSTILETRKDYSDMFARNTVSIGAGKRTTTFKATVTDVKQRTCFIEDTSKNFFCVEPNEFIFEKIIDKNSTTVSQKLFFSGKKFENKKKEIDWTTFSKDIKIFDENADLVKEPELVYEESFSNDSNVEEMNVIKSKKSDIPHYENYLGFFHLLKEGVLSNVSSENQNEKDIINSISIHKYVTDKGNEEIYKEAAMRVKDDVLTAKTSINKSKFIFLIADIQKDAKAYKRYREDLAFFTKGIVKDININSRGVLEVSSPNGPEGIWTISNGTSVLAFFITLVNWLGLPFNAKSYKTPSVILLDETDAIIHPTILKEFIDILRSLSRKVQVFITTHSPYFLDGFSSDEIYYIKDSASMAENKQGMNRCNIYDYKTILDNLPSDQQSLLKEMKNSELFIGAVLDGLFPVNELEND
ncbi:MAG: AAA family ATPase [bacterium]